MMKTNIYNPNGAGVLTLSVRTIHDDARYNKRKEQGRIKILSKKHYVLHGA